MYTIENSITEFDVAPIINLALANYVDLVNKVVRPSGPTGGLCKEILKIEINEYLQDILTGLHSMPGAISIARGASGEILGFALGMESASPYHCGISYAAVRIEARKKGILRAMIAAFQMRYTTIELSCHPRTVPVYQALGFRVCGRQTVQVAMRWGVPRPPGTMRKVNLEAIDEVQIAFEKANRVVKQEDWENLFLASIKRVEEIMGFVGSQLPIQYLTIED
ncbi:hypothetical protein ACM1ZW_20755 [Pseudomonas sp. NFX71]|uniref:hypothetical protein n=1 Tax=Pseudomonas sp. NFX71 TaxID=3399121 RepID=UPI003A8B5137